MVVRQRSLVKLVRCVEVASQELEDIAAVLLPTFVYVEDNLEGAVENLLLCGFGAQSEAARSHFLRELGVTVDLLHSPVGLAGVNVAGLHGYLQSVSKN